LVAKLLQPPEVVNLSRTRDYDILIDRTTKWGNPYIMGKDGNRDEVCDKHEKWLMQWVLHKKEIIIRGLSNKWVIEHLDELEGLIIACHCYPKRCHGDTLVKLFVRGIK